MHSSHVHALAFQKCSSKDLLLVLLFQSVFFSLQPSRMFIGMFKTGIRMVKKSAAPYK